MTTALSERTSDKMTHRLVIQAASEVFRLFSEKVYIIQNDFAASSGFSGDEGAA